MTIYANSFIYRGKETYFDAPLPGQRVKDGLFGSTIALFEGYRCPRCHSNEMMAKINSLGGCIWCNNDECQKDDAMAAKGKKAEFVSTKDAADIFGLGIRYKNACLSKWHAQTHYAKLVNQWLITPNNTLLIQGAPNTGKTYFCAAIANALIGNGEEVFYMNIRRFFENVQQAIGSNQNQYSAVSKVASKKFFILDDLGASTNSEWQKEIILDLIDRRYSSMMPTIVTTNLDDEELVKLLGERTKRRLLAKENLNIKLPVRNEN